MNRQSDRRQAREPEPLVKEMVGSLDRLADSVNESPPDLDSVIPTSDPSNPRRWAVAVAATFLIAAGTVAVVLANSDEDRNDFVTPGTGPDAPPARDGPVIFYDFTPGPSEAVLLPEAEGRLEIHNNCTWIRSRFNDALSLIIWPHGTQWREATDAVLLDSGRTFKIGDRIRANGPGYPYSWIEERAEAPLINQCSQDGLTNVSDYVFIHPLPDAPVDPPVSPSVTATAGSSTS